jgi:hypothetical protein
MAVSPSGAQPGGDKGPGDKKGDKGDKGDKGPKGPKGDKGGKGGKGFGGEPETSASFVKQMMAFDKNGDGKLTKDEITDTRLLALFDRADANKDGVVTTEELEALFQRETAMFGSGGGGGFGDKKGPKGKGPKGPPDGKGGPDGPPDGKGFKGPPDGKGPKGPPPDGKDFKGPKGPPDGKGPNGPPPGQASRLNYGLEELVLSRRECAE